MKTLLKIACLLRGHRRHPTVTTESVRSAAGHLADVDPDCCLSFGTVGETIVNPGRYIGHESLLDLPIAVDRLNGCGVNKIIVVNSGSVGTCRTRHDPLMGRDLGCRLVVEC